MSVRPRQFDLIAFDWDGTLFDSTALITRSIQRAVQDVGGSPPSDRDASFVIGMGPVSYTHLRAHETVLDLVCRGRYRPPAHPGHHRPRGRGAAPDE